MVNLNSKTNLQNWKSRGGSTTQERFLEESTQEKASNTAETQPFSLSMFCRPGSFLQIQFPSVQEKEFLGQLADPPAQPSILISSGPGRGGRPPQKDTAPHSACPPLFFGSYAHGRIPRTCCSNLQTLRPSWPRFPHL